MIGFFSTLSIIVAFINVYNPFHFLELGWSLTMPGALANSIQVSSPYLLDGDCVQRFYSHASKMGIEKSCSSQRKAFLLWCVSAAFPNAFQTSTGFVSSPKFPPVKECPVEIQHTKRRWQKVRRGWMVWPQFCLLLTRCEWPLISSLKWLHRHQKGMGSSRYLKCGLWAFRILVIWTLVRIRDPDPALVNQSTC